MGEELSTTLVLVGLVDGRRSTLQAQECPQEAPVRGFFPPDIATATPAGPTQGVESTVVSDAIVRVRLDVAIGQPSERSPSVEEPGPSAHDIARQRLPLGRIGLQRGAERGGGGGVRRSDDRRGRTRRREMDGLVGHDLTLPSCPRTLTVVPIVSLAAATLPDWLNADRLQWVTLAVMALLLVVALGIVRFVQRAIAMLLGLGLIGGLMVGLWVQREDLKDCQATCSCRLFGQDVEVPESPLCGEDRLQLPETDT